MLFYRSYNGQNKVQLDLDKAHVYKEWKKWEKKNRGQQRPPQIEVVILKSICFDFLPIPFFLWRVKP